ncbi:uncharacterized protein [Montipora foliosa]|uniref:uncharacterized protein n=1 Tax=Montipora foliosa TaxID=591990 RepID=UPI0035F1A2F9
MAPTCNKSPANDKSAHSSTTKKRLCEHCDRLVSIRTYNAHKRRKTTVITDTPNVLQRQDFDFHSDSSDLEFHYSSDEYPESPAKFAGLSTENPEDLDVSVDDCNSAAESTDSVEDFYEETDDEAELQFENLMTSSDEDNAANENESVLSKKSSLLSTSLIKLVIIFIMTWKIMHNLPDAAVSTLFCFLKRLLELFSRLLHCSKLKLISDLLPKSLYMVRNFLGVNRDDFEKFIVCPKCSSCYKPEECVRTLVNGRKKGERCSFVEFPRHPQRAQRKPCGASLFKTTRSKHGELTLKAKRVFCYRSVKKTLQEFLKRPGFADKCEQYKKHPRDINLLGDVYDGRVWKNFKNGKGEPFFDAPNTFGCMLNLDWFQPYKDSVYSVGVIYLSFLNLPPQERNKEENIAVVGIIPGPQEPSRDVNPFLDPLVNELLDFWDGVWLDCPSTGPKFCQLAVLCVSCDIPASRKLCGFLGFSARKGCNKCTKEFHRRSFGEKQDFSGFDRDSWNLRTNTEHREHVWRVRNTVTSKKGRDTKESAYGVRFSSLIYLPYFDFISFVVIDPMHNLMLGTTRKMLKVWKELNLLDEKDFKVLQKRVNKLKVPSSIGRIPSKIASSFKGFTADQFKNWALVFSTFALKGVLPDRHLQCWKLFVKACHILCSTVINTSEVKLADELLVKFCRTVEDLYGTSVVTPNVHLHCHLCECILDFGPVYGFWCFSFERYNGILGVMHVNNHQIEVQLMRKFIERQQVRNMSWPIEFVGFKEMLVSVDSGSLAMTKKKAMTPDEYRKSIQLKASTGTDLFHLSFLDNHFIRVSSPVKEIYMSDNEVESLTKMYTFLHKEDCIVYVPKLCCQFSQLQLYDQKLDSRYSRSERSACIMARWYGSSGLDTTSEDLRPGIIQYFFKHTVTVQSSNGATLDLPYTFACVHWYKVHPHARFYFGLPIQVCLPSFEAESVAAFIPVSRIDSVCVVAELNYNLRTPNGKENIVVVVPLNVKSHL